MVVGGVKEAVRFVIIEERISIGKCHILVVQILLFEDTVGCVDEVVQLYAFSGQEFGHNHFLSFGKQCVGDFDEVVGCTLGSVYLDR